MVQTIRSKSLTAALLSSLAVLILAAIAWTVLAPSANDAGETARTSDSPAPPIREPIRLAIIPERDIFEQRRRHLALATYLSGQLNRPVKIVTLNTYEAVLDELAEKKVDGAFLGSLLTVLAHDRVGVRILAKPQANDGGATYTGVLFVRADSDITTVAQLSGKRIAMVKATTAGDLFPVAKLMEHMLLDNADPQRRPEFVWCGTHDDVMTAVANGQADAGAAKNLRLHVYEKLPQAVSMRQLAESEPVPSNALVVRNDMDGELAQTLRTVLLSLADQPEGKAILAQFGAMQFVPCSIEEYREVYRLIEQVDDGWEMLGVSGRRPVITGSHPDSGAR